MNQLLLGCGSRRDKLIGESREWTNMVTVDHNPDHQPDVVHDLESLPLPFHDNSASEIHAYEVLEHTGAQGDWRFFFAQWSDFWRILAPGGRFFATCPARTSPWLWGDPSHRRVICQETLVFLQQPEYTAQIGRTPMSDFRHVYQADFDIEACGPLGESFGFILRAIKPSRITPPHPPQQEPPSQAPSSHPLKSNPY